MSMSSESLLDVFAEFEWRLEWLKESEQRAYLERQTVCTLSRNGHVVRSSIRSASRVDGRGGQIPCSVAHHSLHDLSQYPNRIC